MGLSEIFLSEKIYRYIFMKKILPEYLAFLIDYVTNPFAYYYFNYLESVSPYCKILNEKLWEKDIDIEIFKYQICFQFANLPIEIMSSTGLNLNAIYLIDLINICLN